MDGPREPRDHDDHPCRRPSAPLAALAGAPRPADGRPRGADRPTAARPGVASPAEPLLARPERRGGFPRARLPDERSRHAPRRRATRPDLARLRCERRIPRAACPRDAGGAPAQSEPRLRHRHAGGVDDRRGPGGRGGAAARRAGWRPRPPSRRIPARCPPGGSRCMGRCVDPRGPGIHVAGRAGGGRAAAPAGRRPGGRPVRVRRVALPAPARAARSTAPARDRGRPHPPRRGDGDRRLQPRLAPLVVGVASPDGPGLRRGRIRSADRIPTRGLADRRLRWPLPGRHPRTAGPMARRGALGPRIGAGRGSIDRPHPRSPPRRRRDDRRARPPRARRGGAASRRRPVPAVRARGSSPIALAPIRRRLASEAARSAR